MDSRIKQYGWNLVCAVDQLANAITGGDPDETISSRIAKHRDDCLPCHWACWLIERIDPGHCTKAVEADEGKDAVA